MNEETDFDAACVLALEATESRVSFLPKRTLGPCASPPRSGCDWESKARRASPASQDRDLHDCPTLRVPARNDARNVARVADNHRCGFSDEGRTDGLAPAPYFDEASGSWVVVCVCGERMHFRCGDARWGPYYVCPRCVYIGRGRMGGGRKHRCVP